MDNNLLLDSSLELDSLLQDADPEAIGVILASMGIGLLIVFIIALPRVILKLALWKIFTKAGKKGWASIIPVYNTWTLLEIVGLPGWISLFTILAFIPKLSTIVSTAQLALSIVIAIKLAPLFGKEKSFAVGLIFLPFVFYPMLAFGKAEYVGESGPVVKEPVVEEPIVEE